MSDAQRHVILVKHALPTLEAGVAARHWLLAPEGEAQARRLARELRVFEPFRLVCSPESKAERTAAIVGAELGVTSSVQSGLEELDRPALPVLSPEDHVALNAPIFSDLSRAVVGKESGAAALGRFRSSLAAALASTPEPENLVVVTHGTVITLFVAQHNDIDAFIFWRRLACSEFVVLRLPHFELIDASPRPRAARVPHP